MEKGKYFPVINYNKEGKLERTSIIDLLEYGNIIKEEQNIEGKVVSVILFKHKKTSKLDHCSFFENTKDRDVFFECLIDELVTGITYSEERR